MPSKATLFHNPRCSKSRETLKLLQEKNIDTEVVHYLDNPPSIQTIKDLLTMLDISARDLMRKKESLYKELNLAEANGAELIKAMHQHPILIERPIVCANGKAAIGRPPENVLTIL